MKSASRVLDVAQYIRGCDFHCQAVYPERHTRIVADQAPEAQLDEALGPAITHETGSDGIRAPAKLAERPRSV